jgi:hypothetical protein
MERGAATLARLKANQAEPKSDHGIKNKLAETLEKTFVRKSSYSQHLEQLCNSTRTARNS